MDKPKEIKEVVTLRNKIKKLITPETEMKEDK